MLRPLPAFLLGLACLSAAAATGAIWLDVPFVPQEKNGCGAASISMVMRYWIENRAAVPEAAADARSIQESLFSPEAEGIVAKDMVRYFREHEFRVFAFAGTWPDLEQHLSKGRPLIVCLKPGGRSGPLHYLVVCGLEPARALVLVNDPAQRKLLKMDRASFEREWKGAGNWTLLALPQLPR